MRVAGTAGAAALAGLAWVLVTAAAPAGADTAQTPESSATPAPAPAASSPAPAASSPAPAAASPVPTHLARSTRPEPGRRVWTAADLDRLRQQGTGAVSVLDVPATMPVQQATSRPAPPTALAMERYQQLVADADTELVRLQRERLATVNPFLRGLARDAAGRPVVPRPVAAVDADLERWRSRRAAAAANLERAARIAREPVPTATAPTQR